MVLSINKISNRFFQAVVISSALLVGQGKVQDQNTDDLKTKPTVGATDEVTKSQTAKMRLLEGNVTKLQYPETKKVPTEENFHGIKVTDEYRWLEDADNKDVKAWVEKQNALTRGFLDSYPQRKEIEAKVTKLLETGDIGNIFIKGNKEFQWRRSSDQNLRVLYAKDRATGKEEIVLDPNTFSKDGTTTVSVSRISRDGKYIAYGVIEAGKENSSSILKIRNIETKEELNYSIPNTQFSSIAWLPDSSGFYYARLPEKGSVPEGEEFYHRKIYFHKLGGDYKNDPLIFEPKNFTDWTEVGISEDGKWLTFLVLAGAEKNDVYIGKIGESPEKVGISPLYTGKNGHVYPVIFDNYIYMQTDEGAPKGKIMRVSLSEKDISDMSNWEEVVKEDSASLDTLRVVGGKLVLSYTENVQSKLQIYDPKTKTRETISLPSIGTVMGVSGKQDSSELYYIFESFTVPPTVYKVDLNTLKQEKVSELKTSADFSDVVIRQVQYESKDGTKVPMFLVHKKDLVKNGENKVQLYGYGAFGVSITPMFDFLASDQYWIQEGNVFAIATIRGGGELGEEWHEAARLEKRQNSYDDFIAAAEYLIKEGYTQKEKLAIRGVSNGGLLVSTVTMQRPDLFGAVVAQVPLTDMLHYHKSTVGKFWMSEYGDPDNPEHFKFIYKYSPYHNVKEGTAYPPMFIIAGKGDERVDPMHAMKMAARLQANTSSDNPILLMLYGGVGHGSISANKQAMEIADIETFLEIVLK